MANYKFCPDCSRFLHPVEKTPDDDEDSDVEEKGLYLECDECGYYEKTNTFSAIHFTKKTEDVKYINESRMVKDYVFDKTFLRTKKIECLNSKCPSRGKGNPEIVKIKHDKQLEAGFLCTECNFIWGKY